MNWLYVFIGITMVGLFVEFFTTRLISICFAFGGGVGAILTAFSLPIYITAPVFAVVSVLLILFARKPALKLFIKKEQDKQDI